MSDSRDNVHDDSLDTTAMESSVQLRSNENATEANIRVLDADIVVRGYERRLGWTLFIWLLIILTGGTLGLVLLYWKPEWMLKLTHSVCPLATARLVFIKDAYQQKYVRKLYTTSSMTDDSRQQTNRFMMFLPLKDQLPIHQQDSAGVDIFDDEGTLVRISTFRWFQFQKHKLVLDVENSTFRPLVGSNSILRARIDTRRGLNAHEVIQRQKLFGKNELMVKVTSPFSILVLEALNPFYIFQVYAFIVWYTEGYIYYGWAIVIMSALSLFYTTWQTNYLQRMRRDRFQSSGTVRVIRHAINNSGSASNSFRSSNRRVASSRERQSSPSGFINLAADVAEDNESPLSAAVNSQQYYQAVEDRDIAQLPVTNNDAETAGGSEQHYEKTVDSNELVPGDIIIIPARGCEMYCDAILLNGTCLVNEATLTGESVPVTKAAVDSHGGDGDADDEDDDTETAAKLAAKQRLFYLSPTSSAEQRALGGTSKNMLYAGTKIIQTRSYDDEPVKAVVMRTAYCTVKGELVTSILYPKPVDFSFHNDATKFLIVLAVFACIGMIYTLIILKIRGSDNFRLVLRALDIVTIVVPPALPFAMTMGIVHAQTRLRKAGLFCISPRMINMAGSINLVCFDKTGTLTEDGLALRGVIPLDYKGSKRLSELVPSEALGNDNNDNHRLHDRSRKSSRIDSFHNTYGNESFNSDNDQPRLLPEELKICMATCHELTLIDDGKLTGDPLDLEMFRATAWQLEEPVATTDKKDKQFAMLATVRPPTNGKSDENAVNILRMMSFESKLQRMSVVIRRARRDKSGKGDAEFCVCSKGAPEKIASLCLADSVPENFNDLLTSYTQAGDRVLALAYRVLDSSLKYTRIQRMSRDALERDLQFVGFIVFENRLKPQTIPCIRELKSACIRPVMVTGDNVLTALSVGRQCNIIDTPVVSLLDIVVVDKNGRQKLRRRLVTDTNTSEPAYTTVEMSQGGESSSCCAVDGDTFQLLRDNRSTRADQYQQVLQHGAVFARMTPAQKELLVDDLRGAGLFVGMCGDGANDCGALKSAHMGISLSDQEASAAAPYTYKHANVSCVPTCIKEGRAALETSFGAFKFMAAYSLTQFLSVLILYETNTNISQLEFFYIDLFQVTIIIIVFGLAKPFYKLVRTPPPSRLMGVIPLMSLTLQMVIALGIQVAAYLLVTAQPWFVPTVDNSTIISASPSSRAVTMAPSAAVDLLTATNSSTNAAGDDDEHYYSYQNYAVFTVSTFQYVWLAIAFSRGLPYRRFFLTNWPLALVCFLLIAFDAFLTLKPCSWLIGVLELKLPPTWHFRWYIIALAALNFVLAIISEWWFMASLSKRLHRTRRSRQIKALAMAQYLPPTNSSFSSPRNSSESEMEMDRRVI